MRCQAALVAIGLVPWGLCMPMVQGGLKNAQLNPTTRNQGSEHKLELKNHVVHTWGNVEATATLEANFEGDERGLDLESFARDLTSLHFDDDGLWLKFNDKSTFESAVHDWNWVAEKEARHFILLVTYVYLDKSTFGVPYRVTDMRMKSKLQSIFLNATETTFKESIRNGHLRIETVGSIAQRPSGPVPNQESDSPLEQHELRRRVANSTHWARAFTNATRRWENATAVYKRAPLTTRTPPPPPKMEARGPTYPNLTKRLEAPYANLTRRWTNTTRRWVNSTDAPSQTLYKREMHSAPSSSTSMLFSNHFTGALLEHDTASMTCTSCSTSGSISITLNAEISSSSISKAFIEFSTQDLDMDLNFEIEGRLKDKLDGAKQLWEVDGKRLEIPGLVSFDVAARFGIGFGLDLGGDGKVSFGTETKIKGAGRICLVGCDGSIGFIPTLTPHLPRAAGTLSSTISFSPTLSLSTTTSLFGSSSQNTSLLITAPSLSGELTTQSSVRGGICGEEGYKFGVLSKLQAGTIVGVVKDGKKVGEVWSKEPGDLYPGACFGLRRRELDG